MVETNHPNRRRARRLKAVLPVKFRVNGGHLLDAETSDFTYRSLAIRTDALVKNGDIVVVTIDGLPQLEGHVVRTFKEGFAIRLTEMSIALAASITAEKPHLTHGDPAQILARRRVISPMFNVDAPSPSWGRFAATRTPPDGVERHSLSLITTEIIEPKEIISVWVTIDETKWVARLKHARKRGAQSIVMVLLNEWQIRMAADYGLSISIMRHGLKTWTAMIMPDPVASHVNALSSEITALSA